MFRLLACQEIKVLIYRFLCAAWFHILQGLAVLQGNSGGDARNLHKVGLAIALCHKLGCGVTHPLDIYGEDGHRAGRYIQFRQLHSTGFQLHPALLR